MIAEGLWSLGWRVGELVKIFECLFKKNVEVRLLGQNIILNSSTRICTLLEILAKQREEMLSKKEVKSLGRPKGGLSKSKFDIHKSNIITMLLKKTSVSEISNRLKGYCGYLHIRSKYI